MPNATTHRARVRFFVKEFGDGTPWLMLETSGEFPAGGDPSHDFFGFDLAPGTTFDAAKAIAHRLNAEIVNITQTVSK